MSPAVIDCPHWVPVSAASSWIRLLPASATYTSDPLAGIASPTGPSSSADVDAPPSPESPYDPVADPATVYMSPAVIEIPHCVPDDLAISWTRWLSESARY